MAVEGLSNDLEVGGRCGTKDRDLWAICKTGLNPTKLRRQRPNIQLFSANPEC